MEYTSAPVVEPVGSHPKISRHASVVLIRVLKIPVELPPSLTTFVFLLVYLTSRPADVVCCSRYLTPLTFPVPRTKVFAVTTNACVVVLVGLKPLLPRLACGVWIRVLLLLWLTVVWLLLVLAISV